MASVKLALSVIFLAAFVIFPMKKVEACSGGFCSLFEKNSPRCSNIALTACEGNPDCKCVPWGIAFGNCIYIPNKESARKVVEEHPNLCQSHDDCTKKGGGSFCARYPNSKIEFGWCFTSNVEAESFFEALTNPALSNLVKNVISYYNEKGFLKMPIDQITT